MQRKESEKESIEKTPLEKPFKRTVSSNDDNKETCIHRSKDHFGWKKIETIIEPIQLLNRKDALWNSNFTIQPKIMHQAQDIDRHIAGIMQEEHKKANRHESAQIGKENQRNGEKMMRKQNLHTEQTERMSE
jgi:hypothetical protein